MPFFYKFYFFDLSLTLSIFQEECTSCTGSFVRGLFCFSPPHVCPASIPFLQKAISMSRQRKRASPPSSVRPHWKNSFPINLFRLAAMGLASHPPLFQFLKIK